MTARELLEVDAIDVFHGDECPLLKAMKIEDAYDMRVNQAPRIAALILEEFHHGWGGGELWFQDLQRAVFSQFVILSQPHLTHAPCAQGTDEGEAITQSLMLEQGRHTTLEC